MSEGIPEPEAPLAADVDRAEGEGMLPPPPVEELLEAGGGNVTITAPPEISASVEEEDARKVAEAAAAEASRPAIEPIGPPPGFEGEWKTVAPGTIAPPMQEYGGYSRIVSPTPEQAEENAAMIAAAKPPEVSQQ